MIILIPTVFISYFFISGHLLTPDILLTLFQTNIEESLSYIKLNFSIAWLIIFILFATIIFLPILTLKNHLKFADSSLKLIIGSILFIITLCYFIPRVHSFYPLNILQSTIQSLQTFEDYNAQRDARIQHLKNLPALKISSGGIHILVIGESETRDHMHIYGYNRQNTPWLDSLAKKAGTIIFKNAYSNYTHTVPSLTYALTEKNQYNQIPLTNAFSIVEVAKSAGYETYWISNQQKFGVFDTPIAAIASTADHEIWLNKNMGSQVASWQYDDIVIRTLKNIYPAENSLIIIHLMGNHFGYEDRYPKSFQQFSGISRVFDSYDNSILYNDYILQKIWEQAQSWPHFQSFLYFSDHGEDVDSNDGRGHESTKFTWPMSHIPLIMSFSSQFQKQQSDIFQTLSNNANKYWTNDLLYNVMISILGITGLPDSNSQLDLSSPEYAMDAHNLYTLHGKKPLSEDIIN